MPGNVVHAVDALDRELLEQPLLDHDAAAALVLLGGLEDEVDGAVEVLGLGQVLGRAQQHHRMAVMAAGVHLAGDRRLVVEAVGLVHIECVHVGAQADRPPRGARPQHAHHAGLGQPAMHFQAELLQLGGDDVGGPHFLECRLGMAVNVMPPGSHVLMKRRNTIDDRHPDSPKNMERIVRKRGDGSSAPSMRRRTSWTVRLVCRDPDDQPAAA